MVLMLLSTAPLANWPGTSSSAISPGSISPRSNPFSTSFAAFLKPIFNSEDDLDNSLEAASATKPQFTYPWLKPQTLRTPQKKALPPLPISDIAPGSPTRRESEPTLHNRPQLSLKSSFASRAARKSRYDSVPAVHIQQSPDQITPSPTQKQKPLPQIVAGKEEDHKFDMSCALAGVELDISAFTPTSATYEESGSFSSSVSSIFDSAPEPLRWATPQSSIDSSTREDDTSMIVPLAIEIGGDSLPRGRMGSIGGTIASSLGGGVGASNEGLRRWPATRSSAHSRKISSQKSIGGTLPIVNEAF